jgi:hypothetical protein
MPMVEDLRGGSNLISRDGRGELAPSARRLIERQHQNQREVAGMTPAEVEAKQAAPAVDTGVKQAKFFGAP